MSYFQNNIKGLNRKNKIFINIYLDGGYCNLVSHFGIRIKTYYNYVVKNDKNKCHGPIDKLNC